MQNSVNSPNKRTASTLPIAFMLETQSGFQSMIRLICAAQASMPRVLFSHRW
jgi:hypothetical protein